MLLYYAICKLNSTTILLLDEAWVIIELSSLSFLSRQRKILAQGTLLTTVKVPNLMSRWSGFWLGKTWSGSTDGIQTFISLINGHVMDDWRLRSKIILPEARSTMKSLNQLWQAWWPFYSQPGVRFYNEYDVYYFIKLFRSLETFVFYIKGRITCLHCIMMHTMNMSSMYHGFNDNIKY